MKLWELLKMALANQRQRPVRTLLNLFGVTLGTVVFIMTAAGGDGVREAFLALFNQSDMARRVQVYPDYRIDYSQLDESLWAVSDDVESDRRERMSETLKDYHAGRFENTGRSYQTIDLEKLEQIKQTAGVVDVIPSVSLSFGLEHNDFNHILYGSSISSLTSGFEERLLAGVMPTAEANAILLHEVVAYEMGYHSVDDLQKLVGKTVSLHFRSAKGGGFYFETDKAQSLEDMFKQSLIANKAIVKLIENASGDLLTQEQRELLQSVVKDQAGDEKAPPVEFREDFKIAGVYRGAEKKSVFELFGRLLVQPNHRALLPQLAAERLHRKVHGEKAVYYNATSMVGGFQDLASVEESIKSMGLSAFSARDIFENVEEDIERTCRIVNYVALGILVITAIGISNTLIISVMERTPEFGIMKALGAANHHVLILMLFEGFLLGLMGSLIAVGVSFVVAMFGDQVLRMYIEGRINDSFQSGLFSISWQSILYACAIAVAVCCTASIVPAWRAARLDPVVAMRKS